MSAPFSSALVAPPNTGKIAPYVFFFSDPVIIRARKKLHVGDLFNLFRLTSDWANSMDVTDWVLLCDKNRDEVFAYAEIVYLKKVSIQDMSYTDTFLYTRGLPSDKHSIFGKLAGRFGKPITEETVITVICVRITKKVRQKREEK